MTTERIDVLAVMDRMRGVMNGDESQNSNAVYSESMEARTAVAELVRLVGEIDGECSNNKPDFGRVVKLAAEAAALARVGAP